MAHAVAKVVIWDLGGTLVQHNPLKMMRELGGLDFLIYTIFHWHAVRDLKTKLYEILFLVPGEQQQEPEVRDGEGAVVPPIMGDWLAGKKTGEQVLAIALRVLDRLDREGYFTSKREKRLLIGLLHAVLVPSIFVRTLTPIDPAIELLRQCAISTNKQGHRYTMMMGSNLDAASFDLMYHDPTFASIFAYIQRDHAVISGSIGITKPDRRFFDYILQKYHLSAGDCVFIDDQEDNVRAAEAMGIKALRLNRDDKNAYTDLQKQLQAHGVLNV